MKKQCIISYASMGRENYPQAMKRLILSAINVGHAVKDEKMMLMVSPDIDVDNVNGILINKTFPIGMPSHKDVPYAFKPWLFKTAFEMGFEQVLWCDSTIVIYRKLNTIWDIAESLGACLFDNPGCPMRHWTSDDCMEKINCPFSSETSAMFNQIMACSMAFDYSNPRGKESFDEWFDICNDGVSFAGKSGSSRPDFRAHRHDQSVMTWLAQKYGIPLIAHGTLIYNNDRKKYPNHIMANTGVYEPILRL